jgi:hypothetical protein
MFPKSAGEMIQQNLLVTVLISPLTGPVEPKHRTSTARTNYANFPLPTEQLAMHLASAALAPAAAIC